MRLGERPDRHDAAFEQRASALGNGVGIVLGSLEYRHAAIIASPPVARQRSAVPAGEYPSPGVAVRSAAGDRSQRVAGAPRCRSATARRPKYSLSRFVRQAGLPVRMRLLPMGPMITESQEAAAAAAAAATAELGPCR